MVSDSIKYFITKGPDAVLKKLASATLNEFSVRLDTAERKQVQKLAKAELKKRGVKL